MAGAALGVALLGLTLGWGAGVDVFVRPESLGIGYMDSMEGPGGRTPRPATPRRLYRGLRDRTDTPSGAHGWEPCRAEGALTSGCIALHYSPGFV